MKSRAPSFRPVKMLPTPCNTTRAKAYLSSGEAAYSPLLFLYVARRQRLATVPAAHGGDDLGGYSLEYSLRVFRRLRVPFPRRVVDDEFVYACLPVLAHYI